MEGGPYSNKNLEFKPNVFVDITPYIDKKIELINCYDSYFNETLLHNIKGLAAYRGQMTQSKAVYELSLSEDTKLIKQLRQTYNKELKWQEKENHK